MPSKTPQPPRAELPQAEVDRIRARERYAKRMRAYGTPIRVTPKEFKQATEILNEAHDAGMSWKSMEGQLGVHRTILSRAARGFSKGMTRDNYDAVMALKLRLPDGRRQGARRPALGSIRRVDALRALGFPKRVLFEYLGMSSHQNLPCTNPSRPFWDEVFFATHEAIRAMYEALRDEDPYEYAEVKSVTQAKRRAAALRLPSPSCWDDDTIDDPEAIPEWTGHCGTGRGKWIHQRDGIPMCQPCSKQSTRYVRTTGDEEYRFDHKYFRAIFERMDMGVQEFADFLGTAHGTLLQWLSGERQPNPEKLEHIAGQLRMHVSELKL